MYITDAQYGTIEEGILEVDTSRRDNVEFNVELNNSAYLKPDEVEHLIAQLQAWIDLFHKGGDTMNAI